MEIIAKYIHGSGDSLDTDVYYVVDKMPPFQEAKKFCDSVKDENANLITIKDGIVSECYKGTPDECNNSLLATYMLHMQEYPLLIERKVERDVPLKCLRAVRIILSHLSRSQYRSEVKAALKSEVLTDKLQVLSDIDLSTIDFDSLSNNMAGEDILKVIAFQIGQVNGLRHGTELYTKKAISNNFWGLGPFLYRINTARIDALHEELVNMCAYIAAIIDDQHDGIVNFCDGSQYNVLKEERIYD